MNAAPHIVITRPPEQAASLAAHLRDHGAVPVFYPGLAFAPCDNIMILDAALAKMTMGQYDMMILTSPQAARVVSERVTALELNFQSQLVWTVGSHTAAACKFAADIQTPAEARDAATLLKALPDVHGKRILLPQSPLAKALLCEGLKAQGADVHLIHPYRVIPGVGGEDVPNLIRQGVVRAFTFFSGSAVEGVMARLEMAGVKAHDLAQIPAVCFGAQTATAARAMDLSVWEGDATYDTFFALLERAKRRWAVR